MNNEVQKKLYRSQSNKIISGILGGIGEYLEIDPSVVRVIFILVTCLTGFVPGIIFYFIALFVVPQREQVSNSNNTHPQDGDVSKNVEYAKSQNTSTETKESTFNEAKDETI